MRRTRSLTFVPALALAIGLSYSAPAWVQSAAELYERGLVAYNNAEVRTAYIHLKNALEEDPRLLSALLLLGRIQLALGKGADAEEQFLAADRLGAHRSLTLVPLAQAYLLQGKAQQVIADLFPLGLDVREDAALLALRGQAHLDLGELFDAERAFDQAWERAPDLAPALLGRVQTRLLRGAVEEALAGAQRAVELEPNNAHALYLKAGIERDLGDSESALADFERAVQVEPAHLPAQVGRIGALLQLDRIEEAAAAIALIRDAYPRDPRALYLEAIIANRQGDEQAAAMAMQAAENLLAQLPGELIVNHSPTLLLAGMVAFSMKKWEQAGDYLDLYSKRHPDQVGPRKLLAEILLEREQYESVISLLEPALELMPFDHRLMSLLAEAYMRDGLHLKASAILGRAIGAKDDDLALQTQRAVNTLALGRSGQAIDQLIAIREARPEDGVAGATLAAMLMQKRQYGRAAEIADDLVRRHPQNLTYLNLKGVVHLALGDQESAVESLEAALAIDPRFVPARLNFAKLDLSEGRAPEAQARLEALLEDLPGHTGAMLELARAYEAQGLDQEAVRWAENALGAAPQSADVAVYLIDLLLESGESAKAVEVAEAMELRVPDDADVLASVARAYIASGRRSTAQVVLQRTSSLAGYDARILKRVATLQQQAGDLDGAVWSLQKAVEGEPDFVPARISLGEILAASGRFEKAELVAESLRRQFPDAPFGYHLMGIIAQRQEDNETALNNYLAALERDEDSPILSIRAYEAKRLVDGEAEAVAFLRSWVDVHPGDAIAHQALAEAYFRAGNWDEAQALFEQSFARSPDSPLLLNNLALLFLRKNDPRALEYAQKAHELLPGVPQIADTLGWILVRAGRPGEGLKHLRDAQSRGAGDPGISYHIAVALRELGRAEEALRELQSAIRHRGEFRERMDAEALLEQLKPASSG